MSANNFYGAGFPYRNFQKLPGKLIVVEGTDGVGRSTQIRELRHWLESEGYAVSDTGLTRSVLTSSGLEEAKSGHTLGPITMSLFYAADFADRLENLIIPALSAGFVVLSDRYFYSVIARNAMRGLDKEWTRKLYGMALRPDLILYLKANVTTLVSRLVHGRGLNYWESGMDMHFADNMYDSFVKYQTLVMKEFDEVDKIIEDLKSPITQLLRNRLPKEMKPN
jgi:dTMP kinase